MKTWNSPVIKELNLSGTEFGSAKDGRPDYVFNDQYGNVYYSYSGVGPAADHDHKIDDEGGDHYPLNP